MPTVIDMVTGRTMVARPSEALRSIEMPYGMWTCADGREVLFNRFCNPIWSRAPEGAWERANRMEKVEGIVAQSWFYGDQEKGNAAKTRKAVKALSGRGLEVPDRSLLVDHDKLVKAAIRAKTLADRMARRERMRNFRPLVRAA